VASHYLGERYRVGRALSCGLDDGGYLAEEVRAAHPANTIAGVDESPMNYLAGRRLL
jgi:hypothetical protein